MFLDIITSFNVLIENNKSIKIKDLLNLKVLESENNQYLYKSILFESLIESNNNIINYISNNKIYCFVFKIYNVLNTVFNSNEISVSKLIYYLVYNNVSSNLLIYNTNDSLDSIVSLIEKNS